MEIFGENPNNLIGFTTNSVQNCIDTLSFVIEKYNSDLVHKIRFNAKKIPLKYTEDGYIRNFSNMIKEEIILGNH